MCLTYADATMTGSMGESRVPRLMVDSGASYSLIPEEIWKNLELEPQETLEFALADGAASECKTGR